MEMCDVFDESEMRTGQIVARGTHLRQGEYYLVVQVWIRNEAHEYLIQQRAMHLSTGPGIWATTAGYVMAGEESIDGAIREVEEELAITLFPTQLKQFIRLKMDDRLENVWIADVSKAEIAPVLNVDVSDWKWASKQAISEMIKQGTFFGYSYFDTLPA